MKPSSVVYSGLAVLALAGFVATAGAEPRSGRCWVDLYRGPDFSGTQARVFGPVDLANLRDVQGAAWDDAIESLEVGPGAEVSVYENENFVLPKGPVYHQQELQSWGNKDENFRAGMATFTAGHKAHHLGEFGLHRLVSAMKVKCTD
ncbi:MAG: hypothetical protein PHT19_04100 [Methylococcus sp.]|nr:hypothetical protein [Methylococcus sp.]